MAHRISGGAVLDVHSGNPVTNAAAVLVTRTDEQIIPMFVDEGLTVPLATAHTDATAQLPDIYLSDDVWGGTMRFDSPAGTIRNPVVVDELPEGLAMLSQFDQRTQDAVIAASDARQAAVDAQQSASELAGSIDARVTKLEQAAPVSTSTGTATTDGATLTRFTADDLIGV